MPIGPLALLAATGAAAAPLVLHESADDAAPPEARAMLVATGIAQITGLAISPLLVLCAIGWRDFLVLGGPDGWTGAAQGAADLPLHANLWLLVPCTLVLGLLLGKKFASPATPLPIRKVLDAAEYMEAKLSALVAAGVLLPTIIATMSAATGEAEPAVQAASLLGGLGAVTWTAPLALVVYLSVWVTFHAVDALVVLSPFAIVDAVLVAMRTAILAVIGLAFLASPLLAFIVCLPIVVVSLLVAGWCVRLDLFALGVAGDLLLRRWRHARPEAGPLRAFLASGGHGAPVRTMGHLEETADGVRFRYRPFFILPARTLAIRVERPAIVRGVIWSNLADDARGDRIASLPPRYQTHHAAVCARFGASARDGRLRRGLRGLRDAFAVVLGGAPDESTA
ncbi:MAG: hypothetical protein RLZZ238_2539 [Planctomycetota bacterium]|jgi:hypothetical protein